MMGKQLPDLTGWVPEMWQCERLIAGVGLTLPECGQPPTAYNQG